jgi:hypothetical protein
MSTKNCPNEEATLDGSRGDLLLSQIEKVKGGLPDHNPVKEDVIAC